MEQGADLVTIFHSCNSFVSIRAHLTRPIFVQEKSKDTVSLEMDFERLGVG